MGEYNYRLPRRALAELRDLLCALPLNDPLREARNGKVLGRTPTFDRDQRCGNVQAERARFFVDKENGAGSAGRTVTKERVRVAGIRVSFVKGRRNERSGVGGMFTND